MKLISVENNCVRFLGATIFKTAFSKKGIIFCLFGIPLFKSRSKLSKLIAKIKQNTNFDMSSFDAQIADMVSDLKIKNFTPNAKNAAFFATACHDMGGHTKCIVDLAKSLSNQYEERLFLTQKSHSFRKAPLALHELQKILVIDGEDTTPFSFQKKVLKYAQKIAQFQPKTLLVYINPDDVFATAVLAVLKKNTDTRILFINHASHFPSLGMNFADVILECLETAAKITCEKRHLKNLQIIGLQSKAKDETQYYSKQEINDLKETLGINSDNMLTMSGGASYKFFDKNDHSDYFEMIKRLLKKEPTLKHVVITQLNQKQNDTVEKIFKNEPDLRKRLIFVPYQKNFDKYFQCADVFIDSFPVSSALTQIDLMRNKVASVVKINREMPEFSFHEYQMKDYPYMFENVDQMEKAISELLHNEKKREEIIVKNYEYWLKTYERDIVRAKYIKVMEDKQ